MADWDREESNQLSWWIRDAANSICGQTGAKAHQEKLLAAANELELLHKAIRDIDRKNDNPGKFNIEIDQITSSILRATGP